MRLSSCADLTAVSQLAARHGSGEPQGRQNRSSTAGKRKSLTNTLYGNYEFHFIDLKSHTLHLMLESLILTILH